MRLSDQARVRCVGHFIAEGEELRCVGDFIAAVAAADELTARAAAELSMVRRPVVRAGTGMILSGIHGVVP